VTQRALPTRVYAALAGVAATAAIGLNGMQSVIPAIAREVGIPDVLMVMVFALSSLAWAVCSPIWAAQTDRFGQKRLIVLGEAGLAASMVLCALVVLSGVHRWTGVTATFVLLLLARGLFGFLGAASQPATQAFVAHRTTPAKRTRALAGLAGAFGIGTIIGPAIAPIFVLPHVGLSGPLFAFGLMGLVVVAAAARVLPETPPVPKAERAAAPRRRKRPLWRDPRVMPFLVFGFIAASCQAMQLQVLGFMIIDRLGMPPMQAQGFTAVAMMAGAFGALLAQWGLIQMFQLGPRQLLRYGPAASAAGSLLIALAPSYPLVVAGYALASVGFGFMRPGYAAGASLAVRPSEQARVAGAITAVNGASSLLAPVTGILLYHWLHPSPYLITAAVLGGLVVFAVRHPTLKKVRARPSIEEDEAATLQAQAP
jgi:MFS family permease